MTLHAWRLGQLRFSEDPRGLLCGLIAWAYVDHPTLANLATTRNPIDTDDWRSGSEIYVVAALFPGGGLRRSVAELLGQPDAAAARNISWRSRRTGRLFTRGIAGIR